MEKLGFIGLGLMGRGMAKNLLSSGFNLTVWNRTASRMSALVHAGASAASSPGEVAQQSDVIFICVSDTPDVEHIMLGEEGVLQAVRPGSLVVDMSTIRPSSAQTLANKVEAAGACMLDAPVSGGSEGAANGTLAILVGGEADQVERAMPYFRSMGNRITHVGGHGHGQMAKLVNQILVVGHALAMSEALLFAQAGDLDLEKTLEAVSGGAAGSWMLAHRGPQILVRDWRPGFTIDLQQKDVRLALEEAEQLGVPLMVTALVHQLYQSLQRAGLGGEGNHALIKALERMAGLEVGKGED
jgi:3-hydroxyisobutyrate dehydrogenase